MKQVTKIDNLISIAGSIVLFVGLILQFVRFEYAPYIYLVGAIAVAWMQVKYGYDGNNIVIRRLRKQQLIGAMLLIMTGVLMIIWSRNEWVLCLSISAVLQLYTAFRIPQEEAKEEK